MRHERPTILAVVLTGLLLLTACSGTEEAGNVTDGGTNSADVTTSEETRAEQRFPDVLDAELEPAGDTWRLSATLSSPYDTPERYADAFRALTPDGTELGVRVLLHDHANEQPFTRSLTDLAIPDDVEMIVVEGRDLEHGWGGGTVTLEVPSDG